MANTRANSFWLWLCGFVILLPTLAMPLGQDQATFFRGGRAMLEGGLLYADFVDVKPPLLYLIYGAGGLAFGSSALGLRIFDLLWQGATIALLIAFLRSRNAEVTWTWCAVFIYALLYTTLGHAPTAQAETLFALPLIGILMLVDRSSSWSRDTLLGMLFGIAFLLKYPLAITGPAVVALFLIRGDGWKKTALSTVHMVLGSLVFIIGVTWSLIADPRFSHAFADVVEYLGVYTASSPWSLATLVAGMKATSVFVGDNISIIICAAFIIGILASKRHLIVTATLITLFLALSIVIERKFQPYHFARLYVPVSVVGGLGLSILLMQTRQLMRRASTLHRATLVSCCFLAVVFTPIPRFLNITRLAVTTLANPEAYTDYIAQAGMPCSDYQAVERLKTDLTQRLRPSDRVMLVSMMATPIAPFLPTRHLGSFADSHFYLGTGATASWKAQAALQLAQADWVIVDTADVNQGMNLHGHTSWQSLRTNDELWHAVADHHQLVDTVACFYIYQVRE